ncbi:Phospholipid phosphatase 3 [Branchiostoma belcheri]|nr:Phospholipid phosphatase 3 [Branchiostoma belcheri]
MGYISGLVKNKKNDYVYVLVDVAVMLLLALPLVLVKTHVVEPADRLFYCDDVTISFPAKKEQFPTWLVYVLGLAIPMVTIGIVEMEAVKRVLLQAAAKAKDIDEIVDMSRDRVSDLLHGRLTRALLSFKFGFLLTDATGWVTALTVGEFQPSFLSYCRPNVTDPACAMGLVSVSACSRDGLEVNDHSPSTACCQGIEQAARCGRAAEVRYGRYIPWQRGVEGMWKRCMEVSLWAFMYLQVRWPWGDPLLVRPLVQILALVLAQVSSLSQLADNEHVFGEILAGWIFGGTTALLMAIEESKLRREELHVLDSGWD